MTVSLEVSVFGVLVLMYRYAYKQADALQLNEIERFDTKSKITTNKLMAIIPLVSVCIAIVFHSHWVGGMLAGFSYFLYTPVMFIFGSRTEKARKALLASLKEKEQPVRINE